MRAASNNGRLFGRTAALGAACLAAVALAGCSSKPALPSNFEVIGKSSTDAGDYYTLRDVGTGCEFVSGPEGMMPRNERSADGMTVKQRCVLTGDEAPVGPTPGAQQFGAATGQQAAGQPAFTPQGNPVGADAQEEALRAAIREQTQGAIPPAAPSADIPPPKGARRAAEPEAQGDNDVESQLKQ